MYGRRLLVGVALAGATLSPLLLWSGTVGAEGERVGTERSAGAYVDDTALAAKVKMALANADDVKARDINVDVREGVVKLSGTVGSVAEAEAAGETARRVTGVQTVENHLNARIAR